MFVSEDPALEGWPADSVAAALAQIAAEADAKVVLLGSTRRGKELAGRLAEKLGAGAVTDVSALELEDGAFVAARYAFAGATVAREKVASDVKVFAVMPKTFSAEGATAGAGTVVTPALQLATGMKVVERRAKEGDTVSLDAAPRIVGVGRGFGKQARTSRSATSSPRPSRASSAAPRASPTSSGSARTASSASPAPRRPPTST